MVKVTCSSYSRKYYSRGGPNLGTQSLIYGLYAQNIKFCRLAMKIVQILDETSLVDSI